MTDYNLTSADRAALQLALDTILTDTRDPDRIEQVQSMVAEDGWYEAATFAAYSLQTKNLALRPWESPPCAADVPGPKHGREAALKLLGRMRAAGISRYAHDPMAALEQAGKG
ncbi:hypothetical protein ACVJGC_005474 [Bradyrhizobium diazoefficiens]